MLLAGSALSILIARSAYKGYGVIKSPTLLRLFLAFMFIGIGFLLLQPRQLLLAGLMIQMIGYFLLALSYSIQSLRFKHMIPVMALISIALSPLFIIPGNSIEHIIRSISFVLMVYGAINAFLSHMWNKNINTLIIANGLSLLALGEFVSWYSFLYPESIFYPTSLAIKVLGLIAILMPIWFKIRGVRINV